MINKVILIGRLGKDPEVKEIGSTKVANFTLATDENYFDKKENKWQNKAEWHKVTAWGKTCDSAEKLKKGDLVYVEGKLSNRSWENDKGEKRKSTEVNAFITRKFNKSGGDSSNSNSDDSSSDEDSSDTDGSEDQMGEDLFD